MQEPAETREKKEGKGFAGYVVWAAMVLLLYVLSWGPVAMVEGKRVGQSSPPWLVSFYRPLYWTYRKTPLHKPLGMYLHLWCPQAFDRNGE